MVATPGRLMDAISKMKIVNLSHIKDVVIDEADMIFDSKFLKEVDQVMATFNDRVTFSVFSATITKDMYPFLKKYFDGVKIIELDNNVNEKVSHVVVTTKSLAKEATLLKLVNSLDPYLCLIFASKKEDVLKLDAYLNDNGVKTLCLHGDLNTRTRAKIIKRINNLDVKFIVCSDIASRGIDIDGVSHVISLDMPRELEYYIHRSGRTGRAQYTGVSYFIYQNEDEEHIKKLEKVGLTFAYFEIENNTLKPLGLRDRSFNTKQTDHFEASHINKIMTKKNTKVKPNHKKKRKEALEKMKKKAKQLEVKQRIKKQRKQRKVS
ncbi:MAG: helicase-related protein [Bacilli bacterium]